MDLFNDVESWFDTAYDDTMKWIKDKNIKWDTSKFSWMDFIFGKKGGKYSYDVNRDIVEGAYNVGKAGINTIGFVADHPYITLVGVLFIAYKIID